MYMEFTKEELELIITIINCYFLCDFGCQDMDSIRKREQEQEKVKELRNKITCIISEN